MFRSSPYECPEGEAILLISDLLFPDCRQEGNFWVWTREGREYWFERRSVPVGGHTEAPAWVRIR